MVSSFYSGPARSEPEPLLIGFILMVIVPNNDHTSATAILAAETIKWNSSKAFQSLAVGIDAPDVLTFSEDAM